MEEQLRALEDEIEDAREDWERKKRDSVPGAAGDPRDRPTRAPSLTSNVARARPARAPSAPAPRRGRRGR